MSSPRLCVVIPCFNAAATIGDLLGQLAKQTLSSDQYEVIVVDDGSTDSTREIVRGFSAVRLLEQSHAGPGQARNLGTTQTQAEYVLYLDSDLGVGEELLKTHLDYHLSHPEVAATGGSVLPAKEWPLFSWGLADYFSSWFNAHPGLSYRRSPEYLPSLNFCVNRKQVQSHDIQWLDGLKHTGEDVVYCHALRKQGLVIAFLPHAMVRHWDRPSFRGHLRHMYRWGHHAPFVRGSIPGLRYGFLFPKNPFLLILTVPAIVAGYTGLIWISWIKSRPIQVTLSLPQLFIGRLAYACGVIGATL